MAKEINTPADFETTRLDGENFDRYIIPSDIFEKIFIGEYIGNSDWDEFHDNGGLRYIHFRDNFIVTETISIQIESDHKYMVKIDGGIFEGNTYIKSGSYKFKQSLLILNGVFNGLLVLANVKYDKFIEINGGVYNNALIIDNAHIIEGVRFNSGVFNKIVDIGMNSLINFVSINGGVFNDKFVLRGNCVNLNLEGGWFKSDFRISEFNCESIKISNNFNINLNKFSFYNSTVSLIFILLNSSVNQLLIGSNALYNTRIKELFITGKFESSAYIKYCQIEKITMFNCDIGKQALLNLSNIYLLHIHFYNTYNYGNINLNSINGIQSLTNCSDEFFDKQLYEDRFIVLKNSDLGKTQFINCDFRKNKFDFLSTKIIDVFITGTYLPLEILSKDFSQQRLGYGQLKKIYESRGDMVEARKYYGKEMIALRKGIKVHYLKTLSRINDNQPTSDVDKEISEINSKIFKREFQFKYLKEDIYNLPERFLLWINRWSNNYGNSWFGGLVFTIAITHVFFGAYAYTLGYWFQFDEVGYRNYYKIFQFFSITGNFDLLVGVPNFWTYLSSLVGRLLIAFGIYQTIAAFRKHGRSGA